jgi:hypothetical protein
VVSLILNTVSKVFEDFAYHREAGQRRWPQRGAGVQRGVGERQLKPST